MQLSAGARMAVDNGETTGMREEENTSEIFDTGLRKIRQELKSQLASHGIYAMLTEPPSNPTSSPPMEATIEASVKGRLARRTFARQQIEGCHLRVGGAVLKEIASIVAELVP
jgi:hypothetical protein